MNLLLIRRSRSSAWARKDKLQGMCWTRTWCKRTWKQGDGSFWLFHSRVIEAGGVCGTGRQKWLRFYRSLVASEFGTQLEFLVCSVVGIPKVDGVEMDWHSPNPCGPESAHVVPESSNSGGKRAQVVPSRGPASRCGHRCVSLCQPLWQTKQPGESGFLRGWQQLL